MGMGMNTSIPVLVVDDSKTMLRIVRQILMTCGFHDIDEAEDGMRALALIKNKAYGLVICDVEMNQMSGLDLLQSVRDDKIARETCFVLMTALKETSYIIAARQLQADSLILKPFTVDMLLEKLAKIPKLNQLT